MKIRRCYRDEYVCLGFQRQPSKMQRYLAYLCSESRVYLDGHRSNEETSKEKRAEGAIASCFRENSLLRLSASWYLWIPRLKARRWLARGDRARSKLIISTERPDNL